MTYSQILFETLNVTSPIFTLVFMGWCLSKIGWLSSQFINSASNLIFSLFLPILIFHSILKMDVANELNWHVIFFGWGFSLVTFLVAWLLVIKTDAPPGDKGVFVQGAFRSNLGILGIALCFNSYGDAGAGTAALILAMVTPLFNVLSVIVLSHYQHNSTGFDLKGVLVNIAKNPLIIAIMIALPISYLGIALPGWVHKPIASIADMTLPLALLCIGGSLDLKALRNASYLSVMSTGLKLMIFPALAALGCVIVGFDSLTVGVVYLMFASPTAAASFVMAKAMSGNATMAANIIALSTVLSAFSVSFGLFVLKSLGWAL